jgi:thiol-disulfide isomerase/thioredoxin
MMSSRGLTLVLLSASLLAACGASDTRERLSDIRLPTASAQAGDSLAKCPTAKCLTIYVAPWCGYCRAATPQLIKLRAYLKDNGVTTRFVVGKDRPETLRNYAREFGPDTLLDTEDSVFVNGVPHFFVSDRDGVILKETSGMPWGDFPMPDFAAFFGLP